MAAYTVHDAASYLAAAADRGRDVGHTEAPWVSASVTGEDVLRLVVVAADGTTAGIFDVAVTRQWVTS